MTTTVVRSDRDQCAILTLNRPDQLNAISYPMLDELAHHLDLIATDDSRAVVITGSGRAFCAGSDLTEAHPEGPLRRVEIVHRLLLRLRELPKISVAALNGLALGGGLELALACTFRVAAPKAKLGLPEIKLGVIPTYGGPQLLTRLVGSNRALELMLSGRNVEGEEALHIGLVDEIAAGEALETAIALAQRCGQYSLVAQRAVRAAVAAAEQLELTAGLARERELIAGLLQSHDAHEGIRAFNEKRPPVFLDR